MSYEAIFYLKSFGGGTATAETQNINIEKNYLLNCL